MSQINIIGNILDTSGFSVHTRNLANALHKITDTRLTAGIPEGGERLLNDAEIEMLKKPDKKDINLIITSPIYWRLHTNAKRNWVFLIFEGDRIPKCYLEECLNPDIEYIFVASKHTKQALEKTWEEYETNEPVNPLTHKIKIIPHGVDLKKFYQTEKSKRPFTFLCNKGWRHNEDRGGTQYLVKAYLEEFNQEDVELIIKINPAYGIPDINQMTNQLKPNKKEFPKIKISVENLPYEQMYKLYNKADVFVAPTRAEAYNMPCIEAMACGLPVITTSFGGQTDYCNQNNSWIINGKLTEVTWELQYESIKWLTPDINELKKAMREAYENRKLTKQKSLKALETSKLNTWDLSAKKIMRLI